MANWCYLAADEGTGAENGTLHLLREVPHASGNAMLSGDVGSPEVMRCGEKGFAWIEMVARGKAAGGAHTYLGINAIDLLVAALPDVTALNGHVGLLPPEVMRRSRRRRNVRKRSPAPVRRRRCAGSR